MKHMIKQGIFTLFQITGLWAAVLIIFRQVFHLSFRLPIALILYLFVFLMILWLKRLIQHMRSSFAQRFTMKQVDAMTGPDFEEYVKTMLESLGFRVDATKASHDYGADLILYKNNQTIAVQCKRYQNSIGVKAIQEVIGSMAYYQANRGLVITNSSYTKSAETLAAANGIALWDRSTLLRMMEGGNMAHDLRKLLR